jgi:hypothetical protein
MFWELNLSSGERSEAPTMLGPLKKDLTSIPGSVTEVSYLSGTQQSWCRPKFLKLYALELFGIPDDGQNPSDFACIIVN